MNLVAGSPAEPQIGDAAAGIFDVDQARFASTERDADRAIADAPPEGAAEAMHQAGCARPAGESLAKILCALIADAVSALDHDHEATRALLRWATVLLESEEAQRGLFPRIRPQAGLAPWQAGRVARHIECNLDRPLLLGELARIAELSDSYFSRAFKGTFGRTPHAFIIQRRVERARREMLEGEDPLSQIAVSCGFADQAHLARLFRRATGVAPSEWRRANRPQSDAPVCHRRRDPLTHRVEYPPDRSSRSLMMADVAGTNPGSGAGNSRDAAGQTAGERLRNSSTSTRLFSE